MCVVTNHYLVVIDNRDQTGAMGETGCRGWCQGFLSCPMGSMNEYGIMECSILSLKSSRIYFLLALRGESWSGQKPLLPMTIKTCTTCHGFGMNDIVEVMMMTMNGYDDHQTPFHAFPNK